MKVSWKRMNTRMTLKMKRKWRSSVFITRSWSLERQDPKRTQFVYINRFNLQRRFWCLERRETCPLNKRTILILTSNERISKLVIKENDKTNLLRKRSTLRQLKSNLLSNRVKLIKWGLSWRTLLQVFIEIDLLI